MEQNELIIEGGAGLTSCLSVRLHEAAKFHVEHGHFPARIDSSKQFYYYRGDNGDRIDYLLLGTLRPDAPFIGFNHGWQMGWYDEINLPVVSSMALHLCQPSVHVLARAADMIRRMDGRTAILYRGNDKAREIPKTPYEAMAELAGQTGSTRFFVQTDEEEFLRYFHARFPDTIAFDEIPRMKANPEKYVMPTQAKRPQFALNFNAVLFAIGQARQVVCTTGNTALWAMIYRGHTRQVWQYHGREQKGRAIFAGE